MMSYRFEMGTRQAVKSSCLTKQRKYYLKSKSETDEQMRTDCLTFDLGWVQAGPDGQTDAVGSGCGHRL